MDDFIIKGPYKPTFTPEVVLSISTKKGYIRGESYQEEPLSFYKSLIEWFDQYFEDHQVFELDIELSYINSSCSRIIVDLLKSLKEHQEKGGEIVVNWYYDAEDDEMEMMEDGEDLIAASGFDMKLVAMHIEE